MVINAGEPKRSGLPDGGHDFPDLIFGGAALGFFFGQLHFDHYVERTPACSWRRRTNLTESRLSIALKISAALRDLLDWRCPIR